MKVNENSFRKLFLNFTEMSEVITLIIISLYSTQLIQASYFSAD